MKVTMKFLEQKQNHNETKTTMSMTTTTNARYCPASGLPRRTGSRLLGSKRWDRRNPKSPVSVTEQTPEQSSDVSPECSNKGIGHNGDDQTVRHLFECDTHHTSLSIHDLWLDLTCHTFSHLPRLQPTRHCVVRRWSLPPPNDRRMNSRSALRAVNSIF